MTKFNHLLRNRILRNICFVSIHSYFNYEVLLWGAAFSSYLSTLITQQDKALTILARVTSKYSIQSFYKSEKIVPKNKILDLETAKFIFEYNNHQLPLTLKNFFQKINTVHTQCTRSSIKPNQMYRPKYHTSRMQRSLKYISVKIWNEIPVVSQD